MVDNTVYYKNNDKWLLVPPVGERQNIATRCHLIGHFGEKTTVERVKENISGKEYTKMLNELSLEAPLVSDMQKDP